MIKLQQLSVRRGARLLFKSVDLTIHPQQKVALTGANGTGKSSLFAVLQGKLTADHGSVSIPASWVIAHVAQETPAVAMAAIEYVLQGDTEYSRLQHQLANAEVAGDGELQSELHEQLAAIDGYTAPSRASRLLYGLGFTADQQDLPVSSFSGGWRMRLNLAQALMCRSDLLLLDEPTNHLDLAAVYWLEQWLTHYQGTLLLISHDRDVLDRVVTQVAHIEQQRIKMYSGNYAAFEVARAAHLAQQQAVHNKQQREIAHIRDFVNRFKAKATKARQAQSRIKALEKMTLIAPAHSDSPFSFRFFPPARLTTPLLNLVKAGVAYHEQTVLANVTVELAPGDRIGLLGANGAGKSTLIKLLAGVLPSTQGKRKQAKDINIGYFAQHQLEQLIANETPLQHLQRVDRLATEAELRDYLGGFGFQGDMVLTTVSAFSGGEKARLVLALLVYQRPAILLLDEPTNHLDLEMRLALTLALQDFAGALVVVSHDRHLLRTVADQLWLVAEGNAVVFAGDLEEYHQWLVNQDKASKITSSIAHSANKKDARRNAAAARYKLQPLQKKVNQAEQKMDQLQQKLDQLAQRLADNSLYTAAAKDRLTPLLVEQGQLQAQLAEWETAWLSASEALQFEEQQL